MLSCIRLPCMCVSVCVWWVGGGQPCTDHVRITFGSRSDHASDHRFPEFRFKISFYFIHVRLLVDIQFRSATVHSSVTQPEPASLGSVLPRSRIPVGALLSASADCSCAAALLPGRAAGAAGLKG